MKAALGKIKITPSAILGGPNGKPMAGYSPIPKITGIHEDIYCHGVLIEDMVLGNIKKRILIFSMDLLLVPLVFSEYIKEKIEEKFKIHPNQILIHATHTHKSFDMAGVFSYQSTFLGGTFGIAKGLIRGSYVPWNDKFKVWIAIQAVKLTEKLIEKLQPAKIAWKKKLIDPPMANNRNKRVKSEQPMGVICFKNSETNKLFGILGHFAAHPTIFGHKNSQLSSEYPGQVTKRLEELNEGIEAIYINGPAGDVSPSKFIIKKKNADEEYWKRIREQLSKRKKGTRLSFINTIYRAVEAYGKELGDYMNDIAKSITDDEYYDQIEFKSYMKRFWVPVDDFKNYRSKSYVKNRLTHFAKRHIILKFPLLLGDVLEPNFPGFALKHRGKDVNIYSQLQIIQLKFKKSSDSSVRKDMNIVGIPGELFEKYAFDIFNKLPTGIDDTFIFQNANDWVSYLFPISDYARGEGIEAFESLTPLAGSYVMNNFYRLWEEINSDITAGYY